MKHNLIAILMTLFLSSSCQSLKIEMCGIKLAESGLVEDSICSCGTRDMLDGKYITNITTYPLSYCDRAITFRTGEGSSWAKLDAFLKNIGRKIKEKTR